MHTTNKVSIRFISLCFRKIFIFLGIELLSSSRKLVLTLYHASHTRLCISSFKHGSWLPISFFIIFKTFPMELIPGRFPGYFRMCISLHLRNVLVLLDLQNGARSCIKIHPFCGNTTHSHFSVLYSHNKIDAVVVFGTNRMRHIMLSVFRLL